MSRAAFALLFFFSSAYASCPNGTIYEGLFNKCYKFVLQPVSFQVAEKSCESLGGSLVSVSNAFENAYIHGMGAPESDSDSFWIGLNLLLTSDWSWINGDNVTYLNWAPRQPADPSAYECAALRVSDSLWTKEFCSSVKSYMCQIDPNSATITTVQPVISTATTLAAGSCHCEQQDYDYVLNPDTCICYKFIEGGGNYTQATELCARNNATMVVILSEEDNQFMTQVSFGFGGWIGLWCYGDSLSSCRWVDGSPLGYNRLQQKDLVPNEPVIYTLSGKWVSYDPRQYTNVVCQKLATTAPEPLNTATPDPTCHCDDNRYTLYPDGCKCYLVNGTELVYNDTVRYCSSVGGSLAVITSPEDNYWITSFVNANQGPNDIPPWIGLWCPKGNASSCTWIDGSALGWSNFQPGAPYYGNPAVYVYPKTRLWYSVTPDIKRSILCQKPAMRTPDGSN